MACFIVSAAEGAVVKALEKAEEKKENLARESSSNEISEITVPMSRKLKWLSNMLFGGSVLLLFEHIWHGEIVPFFPFLTAMADSADRMEMFREMATTGVLMAALITAAWVGVCFVADAIVRRDEKRASAI